METSHICPKCGYPHDEHPNIKYEKRKRELFEKQFGEVLKHSRAYVKFWGRLVGMILGLGLFFFLFVTCVSTPMSQLVSMFSKIDYIPIIAIMILLWSTFGVMGFFVGANMFKSQDEKILWENFDPPELTGN